jgi:thiol:disulfide interchange protein
MRITLLWLLSVLLVIIVVGCAKQVPTPPAQPAVTEKPAAAKPSQPAEPAAKTATPAGKTEGIAWTEDYKAALKQAQAEKKLVMVDVFATWCGPCKRMEEEVWPQAEIVKASKDFVCVKLDGDKYADIRDSLKVSSYPTVLFLKADGKEIERSIGAVPYQNLVALMGKVKGK